MRKSTLKRLATIQFVILLIILPLEALSTSNATIGSESDITLESEISAILESEVDVITEPEVYITSELEVDVITESEWYITSESEEYVTLTDQYQEETETQFYLSEQSEGIEFAPFSDNTYIRQERFALNLTGEAQQIDFYMGRRQPKCLWTSYSSEETWLDFGDINQQRPGYVRIIVDHNLENQARRGYIRLLFPASYRETNLFVVITVTQYPSELIEHTLSLSKTSWHSEMMGSTQDITVISNSVWTVEVTQGGDWLSVENILPNYQAGMGSFRIRTLDNDGPLCRGGVITVRSGGITTGIVVNQASITNNPPTSQPALRVLPGASLVGAGPGHVKVNVESNRRWNIQNNARDWITVQNTTFQVSIDASDMTGFIPQGFGSFELVFGPNHTGRERIGTVEVGAITGVGFLPLTETITVRQEATRLLTNMRVWNPRATGGDINAIITSNANWSAESSDPRWLWIERLGYPDLLRIRAAANAETTPREGYVTIRANELTEVIRVTQAGAITQSLTVNQSNWRPSAIGGYLSVGVGTNSNHPWIIVSSAPSWLTFDTFEPGNRVGNGRFKIRATQNTGTTQRTGTITVAVPGALERTITVTQERAATLTVSHNSWNPLPAGGSLNIGVGTNSNSPWTVVSSSTSWLTVGTFNPQNQIGNGSFFISATPNYGRTQRTGTVTVAVPGAMERVITVTQPAPTLSIRTQSWTPTALGGQVGIGITSNTTWNVTSNDPSWLTVDPLTMTDRTGNGHITIRATPNTRITERIGTITVTANGLRETITVTQAAAKTLTLSPSNWRPSALGGSLRAEVGTSSNVPWTIISSAPSWLTFEFEEGDNGVGTGRFTIRANRNTGTSQRIGTITVAVPGALERTITVTQAGAATLTVSHSRWNPLPVGGSLNIGVGTNSHIPWTAVSSSTSWLTVGTFDPISRTGSGSFFISATPNNGTTQRTGTITVAVPGALEEVITVTQAAPSLSIGTGTWNPSELGGSIGVGVNSNTTWNVTSDATDWLTVDSLSNTDRTGDGRFTVRAAPNTEPTQRRGTITVTTPGVIPRTITVTQAAAAYLTVPIVEWRPPVGGGSTSVNITTNRTWTVTSNATSWLTVSPSGGGGSSPFTIRATANNGAVSREGIITVTAPGVTPRRITVTQQAVPTLTVSHNSWNPLPAGGSLNIGVGTNSNVPWTVVSSSTSWLTVGTFNPPNRVGNGTFFISATPNNGTTQRTGTVTVAVPGALERVITVTQAAQTLSIGTDRWNPSALGGSIGVGVNSNTTWSVTSNATHWLTVDTIYPSNRTGNGRFTVRATPNTGTAQRIGTITVTASGMAPRTINVTQAGAATLTLSHSNWRPTATGGNLNVVVGTNSNNPWTVVSSAPSWLTVSGFNPTNRIGNGSFNIRATPNTGTTQRIGTITVAVPGALERTITVTQAGAATLTVSHSRWNPLPAGGSLRIGVGTNSNVPWTVRSSTSWLTVGTFNPPNRIGNGSFFISAAPNNGTTQRTGTITVAVPGALERVITVTQAAAPASLWISRTSWGPASTTSPVNVDVRSNRTWTVTSSAPSWLTVSHINPANRTGNGSFRINATTNNGLSSRSGTITVTAPGAPTQRITVTQVAAPPNLRLPRNTWNAPTGGGSVRIDVTTNRNWTVTSSATSWLTVSPSGGGGNSPFFIRATANNTASTRSGTITVTVPGLAPQRISVTQQPVPAHLWLSRPSWIAAPTGGSVRVDVSTNRNWNVSSNVPWLTVSPSGGGGNSPFFIRATANNTGRLRTGTITVRAGGLTRTITVSQQRR